MDSVISKIKLILNNCDNLSVCITYMWHYYSNNYPKNSKWESV